MINVIGLFMRDRSRNSSPVNLYCFAIGTESEHVWSRAHLLLRRTRAGQERHLNDDVQLRGHGCGERVVGALGLQSGVTVWRSVQAAISLEILILLGSVTYRWKEPTGEFPR